MRSAIQCPLHKSSSHSMSLPQVIPSVHGCCTTTHPVWLLHGNLSFGVPFKIPNASHPVLQCQQHKWSHHWVLNVHKSSVTISPYFWRLISPVALCPQPVLLSCPLFCLSPSWPQLPSLHDCPSSCEGQPPCSDLWPPGVAALACPCPSWPPRRSSPASSLTAGQLSCRSCEQMNRRQGLPMVLLMKTKKQMLERTILAICSHLPRKIIACHFTNEWMHKF